MVLPSAFFAVMAVNSASVNSLCSATRRPSGVPMVRSASYSVCCAVGLVGATASTFFSWAASVSERTTSSTAAQTVPKMMKGVRRPRLLLHLSEMVPNRGSMKRARTLSSAMMTPLQLWDIPNLSVRILGMMVS